MAVDEYQYRFSYRHEKVWEGTKHPEIERRLREMAPSWKTAKKKFRFLRRTSVSSPHCWDAAHVDMSVVQSSSGISDGASAPFFFNVHDAKLLSNPESFEIEIELDNLAVRTEMMREATSSSSSSSAGDADDWMHRYVLRVMEKLRQYVDVVLQGVQMSMYLIPQSKRREVMRQYVRLMFPGTPTSSATTVKSQFVGPSAVNVEKTHVFQTRVFDTVAYSVTEKADGVRTLLFVHEDLSVYLLDSVLNLRFTGCYCDKKELANTLLDGELVAGGGGGGGNKDTFLAFDVYVKSGEWKFYLPLVSRRPTKRTKEFSRLFLLQYVVEKMSGSLYHSSTSNSAQQQQRRRDYNVSFEVQSKEFFYHGGSTSSTTKDIFDFCRVILCERKYPYPIDGLVFTPLHYGVGKMDEFVDEEESSSSSTINANFRDVLKKEWKLLMKWKPPNQNTIDFLVEVPSVPHLLLDGGGSGSGVYKTLELFCGYSSKYGILNPFHEMLYGPPTGPPQQIDSGGGGSGGGGVYKPVYFTPTLPYDRMACFCNVAVNNPDDCAVYAESGEVIETKSVVEFRYQAATESAPPAASNRGTYWKWIPVRVRHDKTREYRNGMKTFGNDYNVANSIWRSIHDPLTQEMITGSSGGGDGGGDGSDAPGVAVAPITDFSSLECPDSTDVYYHRENAGIDMDNTKGLRDFHNLCVKRRLIECCAQWRKARRASENEPVTLIDFAVGKAGDLMKWQHSGIGFVFGIDVSNDNITNRYDGACVRYLNFLQRHQQHQQQQQQQQQQSPSPPPHVKCVFLCGDSSLNVRTNRTAFGTNLERDVAEAIFDKNAFRLMQSAAAVATAAAATTAAAAPKMSLVPPEVEKVRGYGSVGFDICSMQFAIHYMMKDPTTLHGFLRNVSECTKVNGLFVGTCLDGKKVYRMLKSHAAKVAKLSAPAKKSKKKQGNDAPPPPPPVPPQQRGPPPPLQWFQNNKLVYEIRQKFEDTSAAKVWKEDNWTCLGRNVDVFVDTINVYREEYLVNFVFLEKVMFAYGFVKLKDSEMTEMQFPGKHASGSFEEIFDCMTTTTTPVSMSMMSETEKNISFLNRYFIFRKVRDVQMGETPLFACNYMEEQQQQSGGGGGGDGDLTSSAIGGGGGGEDVTFSKRKKFARIPKVLIVPDIYKPVGK